MTPEEKAKAYDEAIKKATALYKTSEPMSGCNVIIETLFPELKESEDEKIRKALISVLTSDFEKDATIYGITVEEIIAWLEKQGDYANFRDKAQVGDRITKNEDGVLVNISQLERVAKPSEKQCEQQASYTTIVETGDGGINALVTGELPTDGCDDEQKLADKVEPFDKYEGLTDFERTLADICIGWIGEELGWKQYIKDNADVLLKIAIKKFNSVQDAPFEQKPEENKGNLRGISSNWSENDEEALEMAIIALEDMYDDDTPNTTYGGHYMPFDKAANQLKSLRPQNTYNPYKAVVESIAAMVEKYAPFDSNLQDFYDNVKVKCKDAKEYDKMFPQAQWKPSELQIEALESATANCAYSEYQDCLRELIGQLKKLKEW